MASVSPLQEAATEWDRARSLTGIMATQYKALVYRAYTPVLVQGPGPGAGGNQQHVIKEHAGEPTTAPHGRRRRQRGPVPQIGGGHPSSISSRATAAHGTSTGFTCGARAGAM